MAKHVQERPADRRQSRREAGTHHISRAVAMRDMDLTPDEAREMRERIERPTALPRRKPRDLAPGDPKLFR